MIPESRRLEFSEIPIVDLAPLIADGHHESTIEVLSDACSAVGFLYVVNHGVDQVIVRELHEAASRFFTLPAKDKNEVILDCRLRGYLPLNYRSYEGEDRAGTSRQEGFWIGHEQPINFNHPLEGPNQWPKFPTELKRAMLQYFGALESLSFVLHRGFALALGLRPDFFLPMFDNPTSRLKLNHYPPQDNPDNEHDIGVVPHTDSGAFTILWQDENGGLEIQSKNGDWVGAPPIENTFVVNLGNIMQYWTNGRFCSTPHRVINRYGVDRYSIPLFVNPNPDITIHPLVDTQPEAFDPFVYGDYQVELWRRTFPVANIP